MIFNNAMNMISSQWLVQLSIKNICKVLYLNWKLNFLIKVEIHEDFISSCMDRLKASYDTLTVLERDKDAKSKLEKETTKLCRVLKVLHEYVMECDADFGEERTFVPLYRAPRGKQIVLMFR